MALVTHDVHKYIKDAQALSENEVDLRNIATVYRDCLVILRAQVNANLEEGLLEIPEFAPIPE